jgi:hypothetical protein
MNATGFEWIPEQNETTPAGTDLAVVFAGVLITNPLRIRLSGPCERCGRWFIKKQLRREPKTNTCSRQCRDAVRSPKRNKEVRAHQKRHKLELACYWMEKWKELSEREKRKYTDWKDFVETKTETEPIPLSLSLSKQSRDALPLSKKFLTRAVNDKKLKPPREGKTK